MPPKKPRLDMRLSYHYGMKKGTSLADCQCRSCKKWRAELFAQGEITAQEAGIPDVKDEPLEHWREHAKTSKD